MSNSFQSLKEIFFTLMVLCMPREHYKFEVKEIMQNSCLNATISVPERSMGTY